MAERIISPGVFSRENDKSLVQRGIPEIGAAIVGPTVKGNPLSPTVVTSYSEYLSIFGDVFKSGSNLYEYFTSLTAKEYFNNGGKSLLVTKIISGSSTVNNSTYASSSISASVSATPSFVLEATQWGDIANNTGGTEVSGALVSGSSENVRWEVTNVNNTKGTFTLLVRSGNDNANNKNVLETFSNLSLDPAQPNYISRVVGNTKPVYNSTKGLVEILGDFIGGSSFIRVKSVNNTIDSIDNLGNYKATTFSGSLPAATSGSFSGGIAATNRTGSFFETMASGSGECQGFTSADYSSALTLLSNKDEYSFNLLLVPGVTLGDGPLSSLADDVVAVCEGRGDSMAIIDTTAYGSTVSQAVTAATTIGSSYGAAYYPWVQVFSNNLGKAVWCPPSVVMGGVFAFNDQVGAEWFAPAGLSRGGIQSVLRAERRLSQDDRDTLYDANVNPLASFPGEGVVAFGQKTLQKKATALDRINVRRLLITLKNFLGQVGRSLVFEQNTATTRNRFLSVAEPYLESVVQRQGLYAFKIVMDDSNNTSDVIDRNQLVGQIYLQPSKTAEFIVLDFTVLPTGAAFPG
jgi:phage tail sheath protein FI